MLPARVDAKHVLNVQIDHAAMLAGDETRFFKQLALSGGGKRFASILRARHRLPEPRCVGAFDQQRVTLRRDDGDQDGAGDF